MGVIYFIAMMLGAFGYRIPRADWKPAGWVEKTSAANGMITTKNVDVSVAWKTPQFWLLWGVLTPERERRDRRDRHGLAHAAGGVRRQLIGVDLRLSALSAEQKAQVATIAAAFAGLLSLFNIAGRFFWASLSDYIGRKLTYFIFFGLGIALVRFCSVRGHARERRRLRRHLLRHPHHVRRRLRDDSGLSRRTCSARVSSAPFMGAC